MGRPSRLVYRVSPAVNHEKLNDLFTAAWPGRSRADYHRVLDHSLLYVCAYSGERLVGFVNMAWDGGIHAFLLDTTVHPEWQRRGIGKELVRRATDGAKACGIEWLHVDFEPHLVTFYRQCGFRPTEAGLLRLEQARKITLQAQP